MYRSQMIALCSGVLLAAGASLAEAIDKAPRTSASPQVAPLNAKRLSGTIRSVDSANHTFVLKTSNDESVTIMVDDKTSYTLDGKSSTRDAALKAGYSAKVTHQDHLASKVEVSSS